MKSIDVRACTCFKNTCNWGCDSGSTVTSNRGRNILSRIFWNDVTIPISLYILYRRGSCKTENTGYIHTIPTFHKQKYDTNFKEYCVNPKLKSISLWVLISLLDFWSLVCFKFEVMRPMYHTVKKSQYHTFFSNAPANYCSLFLKYYPDATLGRASLILMLSRLLDQYIMLCIICESGMDTVFVRHNLWVVLSNKGANVQRYSGLILKWPISLSYIISFENDEKRSKF